MTSKEIFEELEQLWKSFEDNHNRFSDKQVKAAGVRARKSINEIRKLASKYRSTQLTESRTYEQQFNKYHSNNISYHVNRTARS